MAIITYIRCPICGKLSKVENFHTKHEIPEIKIQEIIHLKGARFLKNIWKKKTLSKDEEKDILLNLKGILERRLERICMLLEMLNIRLRVSDPKIRIFERPMISIGVKPRSSIGVKPRSSIGVKPEVKLWVKQ